MRQEHMKNFGTFFYDYHSIITDSVYFPEKKNSREQKEIYGTTDKGSM